MPDTSASLYMAQLVLDGREIGRSAVRQQLPPQTDDLGYVLHGHLIALFGDLAPKPFRARRRGRDLEVLGYLSHDEGALRSQAQSFAEPIALRSLKQLAVKAMPGWDSGRRLGFEVRVCPVVRKAKAVGNRRAGVEIDAFLAALDNLPAEQNEDGREGKYLSRPEIYRSWLAERLSGSAELLTADLTQYQRVQLVRRTQGANRHMRTLDRPEANFRGELEVQDADAFTRILTRGVGRHRAFGFGMVLLRPPAGR